MTSHHHHYPHRNHCQHGYTNDRYRLIFPKPITILVTLMESGEVCGHQTTHQSSRERLNCSAGDKNGEVCEWRGLWSPKEKLTCSVGDKSGEVCGHQTMHQSSWERLTCWSGEVCGHQTTHQSSRERLTCSVMRTERLRYFLLILSPNVMKRMMYIPSARHHTTSSQLHR